MDESVVNGLGITTTQVISVYELFNNKRLFVIPNYQRNYAWEFDEIKDFISDLSECLKVKNEGGTIKHFFGGLLTIKKHDSRVNLENKYELIDGQQRITTFYIAIAAIVNVMKEMLIHVADQDKKEFLGDTIEEIERNILYVKVRDAIGDTSNSTLRRIKVIDRNTSFFNKLLRNEVYEEPTEFAHLNFKNAYNMLCGFYINFSTVDTENNRINRINQVVDVLLRDFMVLNIESENKKSAYTFFKVLNDRGKNLSYIDLIKADTMQYLSGDNERLIELENSWNYLMKISNSELERYFSILYSYYHGNKLIKLKEYELFKKKIFNDFSGLTNEALLNIIGKIVSDIKLLQKLIDGEIAITNFTNKNYYEQRLSLLMNKLKNTSSLPLLLAVVKLNDKNAFIGYLEVIEKFFFRYKVICSGHATAITNHFYTYAKLLNDGKNHDECLNDLKIKLREMVNEKANDNIFELQIKDRLNYEKVDKKIIKYFLLYLNHYHQSYKSGESPIRVLDTTLIVDFDSLTIEHIYNRNIKEAFRIDEIEPLKDNIMNLTLLPPKENSDIQRANTDNFTEKVKVYKDSAFGITREVAKIDELSITSLKERLDDMILLAKKVFEF